MLAFLFNSLSFFNNIVTVMVTSHEVIEKDIESSGKMILYNMCNIY